VIGTSICKALAAVHSAGLIHGDIKSKNVMREKGGRIVLMDFGLVRKQEPPGPQSIVGARGTPLYMAPELFQGGSTTVSSDIYSLGVVLFRLSTGAYPIPASVTGDLVLAHRNGTAKRLLDVRPDLPEGFVRTVQRALDPDPSQRFQSAGAMAESLSGSSGQSTSREPPTQREDRAEKVSWWSRATARPRRLLVATAALLTVIGAWSFLPGLWAGDEYEIAATFFLRTDDSSGAALESGDRVHVGDQLFLEFRASTDCFVYVINRDDVGAMALLFPNPGLTLQNPLSADAVHQLPGVSGGRAQDWEISTAGGREEMLLIVSSDRLLEFETLVATLPRASFNEPISYASVNDDVLTRAVGRFVPAPEPGNQPVNESAQSVFTAATRMAGGVERAKGTWIRTLTLQNPR
jgi:hypothetical protein